MLHSNARITATGSYVPEKRMTNYDLEKWSKRMMNGYYNVLALRKEE